MDQGQCAVKTSFISTRKFSGLFPAFITQFKQLNEHSGFLRCVFCRYSKKSGLKYQQVFHCSGRINFVVLQSDANQFLYFSVIGFRIQAGNQKMAGILPGQSSQNPNQGGFTRPVRTQQGKKLSFENLQTHIFQCFNTIGVFLAYIPNNYF